MLTLACEKKEREKFSFFKGRVNEKEMEKRKKKYLNNSHKILLA